MNRAITTLILAALLATTPALAEVDLERGRQLHERHCMGCHARMTGGDPTMLYTRENRRVHSLDALERQVRRCETNLELKWFEDDIESVVEYLNREYYRF